MGLRSSLKLGRMGRRVDFRARRNLILHIVFVTIIAALSAGLVIVQHLDSARTADNSRALVLSGEQEMLAQRIAVVAETLVNAPVPGVETELALSIATFDQNYRTLASLAGDYTGPTHIYFESGAVSLQPMVRTFTGLAHDILDHPGHNSTPALFELRQMAGTSLKGQLSAATGEFGKVSLEQAEATSMWLKIIAGLFILTFAGESGLVVFALRRGFYASRTSADKSACDLSQTKAKLEETEGEAQALNARYVQSLRQDALTGLLSRSGLSRHLQSILENPAPVGMSPGIIALDIDGFRTINETHGHAFGDTLLSEIGERLRGLAGDRAALARTDGNGFAFAGWFSDNKALAVFSEEVLAAFAEPFQIGDVQHIAMASGGLAILGEGSDDPARLTSDAEIALFQAKSTARGTSAFYVPKMRSEFEAREKLAAEVRAAVEERAFQPYFQPIVSLSDGTLSGFEMLARWPHDEHGLLTPDRFLSTAHAAGLAHRVDHIVLANGLDALVRLRKSGANIPWVSVNASAASLSDPKFVELLGAEVNRCGLAPEDLSIEVSENRLREAATDAARENLERLHWAGFKVDLDDFGTGYAAMSSLSTLPLRGVKVDRSLVSNLPDPGSEAVLKALVGLAHDLKLTVTAQGVEAPTQFEPLRNFGCDLVQGYGIAKPLSEADAAEWLKARVREGTGAGSKAKSA